jgi:alpha-1,2-mannosyltransferase
VPLLSRGIAGVTGIPLGLLVLLTLYAFTLRRALLDREHVGVAAGRHGIAQA